MHLCQVQSAAPRLPPTNKVGCCRRAASPAKQPCQLAAQPGWLPAAAAASHPTRLRGAAHGKVCSTNREQSFAAGQQTAGWQQVQESMHPHRMAEMVGMARTLRASHPGLACLPQLGAGPELMHTVPATRMYAVGRRRGAGRSDRFQCCGGRRSQRHRAAANSSWDSLRQSDLHAAPLLRRCQPDEQPSGAPECLRRLPPSARGQRSNAFWHSRRERR